MTLTPTDDKILQTWFVDLQTLEKGSEPFIVLRNKIYTYIYKRLSDLLETKIFGWKRKYGLSEEDCISIFHDCLLNCVEKYVAKKAKFTTYFWRACENSAQNYYKKSRCQRRIPTSHIFNVDFDELHNQADIIAQGSGTALNGFEDTTQLCKLSGELQNLYDTDQYKQEITQLAKENIAHLLPSLTAGEAKVFDKICEGHSVSSISRILNLSPQQIHLSLTKIQRKASRMITIYG